MKTKIRRYSELALLSTFEERFQYLRLDGSVGEATFGYWRYINQLFYQSQEWKKLRDRIIIRDHGCDLGCEGYEVFGKLIIHHMNPITLDNFQQQSEFLLNPEYLISTTHNTHNAIHYGDAGLLPRLPVERRPNDTCPWKH